MKTLIRKFLLTLALIPAVAVSAQNYTFGSGSGYTFNINKGTSTMFLVQQEASMLFTLTSNLTGSSNVNFGVYTFDSNNNILSENVYSLDSMADSFSSQNFNVGDQVGFWLEVDGMKRYSVHSMNENGITYDGWLKQDGDLSFGFESNGKYYTGYSNLDFYLDIKGQAPQSAATPSGQPLPGILATVALGGGMFAFIAKRRKTSK